MFTMLVSIEVLPDFTDPFIEITLQNVLNSRQEAGVVHFDFYQDTENPTSFKLLEVYRQEDDRAEHQKTEHFKLWKSTVAPWMASDRTRVFLANLCPENEEVEQ